MSTSVHELWNKALGSKSYWRNRSAQIQVNSIEQAEAFNKQLASIYKDMEEQLNDKMERVYAKFGKDNMLTLEQSKQLLSPKELLKAKMDVTEYIKKAEEFNITQNPQLKLELHKASVAHQMQVIDSLRTQWKMVVDGLSFNEQGGMFLQKQYVNANYMGQMMLEDAGKLNNFNTITPKEIDDILKLDWGHGAFSANVWKNEALLLQSLDEVLKVGLAQGKSYDAMAKEIAKRCDVELNKAMRLVRTESARISNSGLLDSYKNNGVKFLKFVATLDSRTSEICQVMDAELIETDLAEIGYNIPPLHPYCRSTVAPHFGIVEVDERMARNEETGKSEYVDSKTYTDWLSTHLKDEKKIKALASLNNGKQTLRNALYLYEAPVSPLERNPTKSLDNTHRIDLTEDSIKDDSWFTPNEADAIYRYVNNGYYDLNRGLRLGEDLTDRRRMIMKGLDSALNKIKIVNNDIVLQRGMTIDNDDFPKFIADYEEGKIVKFKSYLSTTKLLDMRLLDDLNTSLSDFDEDEPFTRIVYRITNHKTGADFSKYNSAEEEVIFPRDSKFIVTGIEKETVEHRVGDFEYTVIYMEEVI